MEVSSSKSPKNSGNKSNTKIKNNKRIREDNEDLNSSSVTPAGSKKSSSKKKQKKLKSATDSGIERLVGANQSSSPDDDQEENEEDNSEGFISGNGMPLDMPEKMWQDLDEAGVHEESISELNRKCSSDTIRDFAALAERYLEQVGITADLHIRLNNLEKFVTEMGWGGRLAELGNEDSEHEVDESGVYEADTSEGKSGTTVRLVTATSAPVVQMKGMYGDLLLHLEQCAYSGLTDSRVTYLTAEVRKSIDQKFRAHKVVNPSDDSCAWMRWSATKLAHAIRTNLMVGSVSQNLSAAEQLQRLRVVVNIRKRELFETFQTQANKIIAECPFLAPAGCSLVAKKELESKNNSALTAILFSVLLKHSGKGSNIPRANVLLHTRLKQQGELKSPDTWFISALSILNEAWKCVEERDQWEQDDHQTSNDGEHSKSAFQRQHNDRNKHQGQNTHGGSSSSIHICDGCGKIAKSACKECKNCAGHPDQNKSGPWANSTQCANIKKRLLELGKTVEHVSLHSKKMSNGTELTAAQQAVMKTQREAKFPDTGAKHTKPPGELNNMVSLCNKNVDDLIECQIKVCDHVNTVQVLVDTGAKSENFVSVNTAEWIKSMSGQFGNVCSVPKRLANSRNDIRLGGTNLKSKSEGVVSCDFLFFNEIKSSVETLPCVRFRVIDNDIDLIIGLPTIRHYGLTEKIASYFHDQRAVANALCTSAPVLNLAECDGSSCAHPESFSSIESLCSLCKDNGMNSLKPWFYLRPKSPSDASHQLCVMSSGLSKADFFTTKVFDEDFIEWEDDPFVQSNLEVEKKCYDIQGSVQLQTKIRSLCEEFDDIFTETVRDQPADIPPMEIEVDPEKWHINKHRGPPRPQSTVRQQVIEKQVKLLEKLNVIEVSTASEYSQVHLVPKPEPNDWRFCLDYVRLNAATVDRQSWPIPNIPEMIHRIGSKKPKVFGKVDLTSGYHQAPLSVAARLLTAFICFLGIFHWLRVPMGLKNAASYFQKQIVTVVLVNLIYVICEAYIDDIFIFGSTEDEFINNLRLVFERFRKHRITLKPKKCIFGSPQIEFVGHVISSDGVTFSNEKRQKVLDFPLPTKPRQMLAFLGLVNWFREHVPDMTGKTKCLRDMIKEKGKSLVWTEELKNHFYYVRDTVAECQKLFFIDEKGEVTVQTDASDYGYGAYIFQTVNGKDYPIIFISKSFTGAQLNWKIVEKEAFAIFYTLKKCSHLLRDIKFLLQTDHKNLTYLNLESSAKVRNWKLYVQEFNFGLGWLDGKKNVVADHFSRLCEHKGVSSNSEVDDIPEQIALALLGRDDDIRIPDDKYRIIGRYHNSNVGHFGLEKTIENILKVQSKWKYLRRHVRKFIAQCPVCQLNSDSKIHVNVKPFTRAAYNPMEVLNVDTIGPLPEDQYGNKYILVIIDCFSRWVELFGTTDTSAKSAAKFLLQHCGRFGTPALIRSDRGSQFVNDLIADISEVMGTDQDLTTAYSKEENAIVERENKEVTRHLKAMMYDKRVYSDWSEHDLPKVMRILNSEHKTRTGVSPAEILFGNSVDLGRYLLYRPTQPPNPDRDLNEHVAQMLERQRILIEVARETQNKFDSHHMSEADPELTEYPINSYVLFNDPAGNRNKLQTKKRGPFQIVNRVDDTYSIENLVNHKIRDTHVSNLTPFYFDPERINPVEVATHDSQEFVIEKILSHTGSKNRYGQMKFLVRWLGYPPEEDSYEPWSYLKDTEQLHDYLRANNLASLIPKKFRTNNG